MPLIADALLDNLTLMNNATFIFSEFCVSGILANEEVCKRNVENSTAAITALIPKIGYEKSSLIVKTSQNEFISIKEAAIKLKLISEQDFDDLISPESVCRLGN